MRYLQSRILDWDSAKQHCRLLLVVELGRVGDRQQERQVDFLPVLYFPAPTRSDPPAEEISIRDVGELHQIKTTSAERCMLTTCDGDRPEVSRESSRELSLFSSEGLEDRSLLDAEEEEKADEGDGKDGV